jgi:hypothetical protein
MASLSIAQVGDTPPPVLKPVGETTAAQQLIYNTLAQRFRPYIKTSRDGSTLESRRPASWQWFLSQLISVVQDYKSTTDPGCAGHGTGDKWPNGTDVFRRAADTTLVPVLSADINKDPTILLRLPASDIRHSGSVKQTPSYALHFWYGDSYAGEDWDSVVNNGDGIYAHVEELPNHLFNIEYSILWAYNDAYCAHHVGDLTSMTVVYDQTADLITRVTYSVHGYAIESFRIASAPMYSIFTLLGEDDSNAKQSISAIEVMVDGDSNYQEGGTAHQRGSPMMLLAQDPATGRYEHPVGFAERGSHEIWPNRTGSITGAPKHSGTGFAFLPVKVNVLSTNPDNNPDAPFLFFNSKFGSDPNAIMLHQTWYWPEGRAAKSGYGYNRYGIPQSRFTDKDPYINMTSKMKWPPAPEYTGEPPTAYVNPVNNKKELVFTVDTEGIGFVTRRAEMLSSRSEPFPEPFSAFSVVPCGGSISIAAGNYPETGVFDRKCGGMDTSRPILLKALGGTVTLGAVR